MSGPALPGQDPTPGDLLQLAESWIDAAHAQLAHLRRVDSPTGAQLVGRKDTASMSYSGILYPCIWPGEHSPYTYFLRLDSPPLERRGAELRETRKYLVPPGSSNRLYMLPDVHPQWLLDTTLPLVITEGPKKTIALHRLAMHNLGDANDRPRFIAVGLSGVWNWRGKTGIEPGPKPGDRITVKGAIPDLDRLAWKDRRVIVVFDSDAKINPSVQAARKELGFELQRRQAHALFVDLPQKGQSKIGIDDLLAQDGADRALNLIDRARPLPRIPTGQKENEFFAAQLDDVEFFKSGEDHLFANLPINGHRETWPLRSPSFKSWLVHNFFLKHRQVPSAQRVQEVLSLCEARAQFEGPQFEVGVRVTSLNEAVYVDLGDPDWQAVEITPEGWRIVTDPPVKFRRAKGMQPLPWPTEGGTLDLLRPFLNTGSGEDGHANFISLVSWLIGAMNPKGPYPVLILQGQQGSSKSTQARLLRSLIDPNTALTRSTPKEERDLVIAANSSRVISFDNLSGLPHWLSDALCRIATGGGFAARQLHTDGEEIVFNSMRPIILNGIDEVASRPDLADRALSVFLPSIPEDRRILESDFWEAFNSKSGQIFGALLSSVSSALRYKDTLRHERYPRMADFCAWVCAAAMGPAVPFDADTFREMYSAQQQNQASDLTEGSDFAMAIFRLIEEFPRWEGTATELLDVLNTRQPESRKSNRWPKDATRASNEVRRFAPVLEKMSVLAQHDRIGHEKRRIIRLSRMKTFPKIGGETASAASAQEQHALFQ